MHEDARAHHKHRGDIFADEIIAGQIKNKRRFQKNDC